MTPESIVLSSDSGPACKEFSGAARKATHLDAPAPPAALGHLCWGHRHERQPVWIGADEAHNICSQEPADDLEAAATSHAIKIAGEGRRFGLYLLVATQRPSKVHANVLSQCDNLVLMKMNSASDLAHISQIFSQAPATILDQSPHFA
jgi:uncharacterized protein